MLDQSQSGKLGKKGGVGGVGDLPVTCHILIGMKANIRQDFLATRAQLGDDVQSCTPAVLSNICIYCSFSLCKHRKVTRPDTAQNKNEEHIKNANKR